jgi:hypothetical protein
MTEIPLQMNAQSVDSRICEYILIVVSKYLNVPDNFHTTKNRKQELVFARQLSMMLMRQHTKLCLENIGKIFNRDHATVLHGIRHIENLAETEKSVKKQVIEINQIIRHKSKAMVNKIDLNKDYYYIDFNDFISVRFSASKGIMFAGFEESEIHELLRYMKEGVQSRSHSNTGIYILESKTIKKDEEKDMQ